LKLYLVRHARAIPRDEWKGEDLLRPLSERGRSESEALLNLILADPPARIVSAPSLRCQQTVEAVAVATDLDVVVDERLGEGETTERALQLLPTDDTGPVLFCSHADVIEGLLQVLELAEPERGQRIPVKKGSVWVLEGNGYTPSRASYLEPGRAKRGRRVRYSEREVAAPRPVRAGVLDMGSTSFTLLIADSTPAGEIRPVVSERVMLRLGAVVASGGSIPDDVFERAVRVAHELRAVAEQEKTQRFLPVATAALREADNGRELAAAISEALGEPIRILSGEEEARVIFQAFQARLALGERQVLGLDLGGGSLELATGRGASVDAEVTLPLGAVRLHGELVKSDPMRPEEAAAIRTRVREALAPHRDRLARPTPEIAVAAGGTARSLARLVVEQRDRRAQLAEGVVLSGEQLAALAAQLETSSHAERLRMRGIRRRRADLVPTGALILRTVSEELGLDGFTVCDWGLREGILLNDLVRGSRLDS
jgi:exopolyphosphatase/guanosine-5'-triphosphate,3'-diphosphate pyrophosphatase